MSSKAHDFILAALSRKIRQMGFVPVALDGRSRYVTTTPLPLPPAVLRHRPDLVGVRVDGAFCIAEAKTASDVLSARTQEQLQDFTAAVLQGSGNVLFFGVPLSSESTWKHLLVSSGIRTGTQVETVYVPDALLPDEEV